MHPPRHLPGTSSEALRAQDVAGVWETMDTARENWLATPLDQRVATVAEVTGALLERGPGEWRLALERSTGYSSGALDAAWHATFSPVETASLGEALGAEGLDAA